MRATDRQSREPVCRDGRDYTRVPSTDLNEKTEDKPKLEWLFIAHSNPSQIIAVVANVHITCPAGFCPHLDWYSVRCNPNPSTIHLVKPEPRDEVKPATASL